MFDELVLFNICVKLDIKDLINFCLTCKKIYRLIYNHNHIWIYNLNKYFIDWKQLNNINKSPKNIFILIYNLDKLKKEIMYKESLYQLFEEKKLIQRINLNDELIQKINLNDELIQKINLNDELIQRINPNDKLNIYCNFKRLFYLEKLEELYLYSLNLTQIPKEISKLEKLKILNLSNNKITEIPIEIKSLKNLEILNLSNNYIKELPKEIEELTNLRSINLEYNCIENFEILYKMKNLERMYLHSHY